MCSFHLPLGRGLRHTNQTATESLGIPSQRTINLMYQDIIQTREVTAVRSGLVQLKLFGVKRY